MSGMTRQEAEALLVFLANGSLAGPERAEVEAWVARDAGLGAELQALRGLRAGMQADMPEHSPGEFGLARLMREIGAEPAATAPPRADRRLQFWRIAASVAVALLIGQSVLTFGLRGAGDYRLAGEDALAGAELRVAFRPDAREADIRALLLDNDLVIVDGPTALGFYLLRTAEGAEPEDVAAVLRAAALVVEEVETEEAEP